MKLQIIFIVHVYQYFSHKIFKHNFYVSQIPSIETVYIIYIRHTEQKIQRKTIFLFSSLVQREYTTFKKKVFKITKYSKQACMTYTSEISERPNPQGPAPTII